LDTQQNQFPIDLSTFKINHIYAQVTRDLQYKVDGLYFVIGIFCAQETTLLLWLAVDDLPMLDSIRTFPLLFVGSTVG
jgi:hypothetical protein